MKSAKTSVHNDMVLASLSLINYFFFLKTTTIFIYNYNKYKMDENINVTCLAEWSDNSNTQALRVMYENAPPFPHVVLDPFFQPEYALELARAFPLPSQQPTQWYKYDNPLEKKYALNRFDQLPLFQSLFAFLQSDDLINVLKTLTGIADLENDPFLHGAGLHYHDRESKLDMHLDYSIHPLLGKERRLNLIVYLNEHWDDSYNGGLELWDRDFTAAQATIMPSFNKAVLFQTSDISYHGVPRPIACPPENGAGRKSLAIYYLSPLREHATHRAKAQFRPLPHQTVSPALQRLYDIRPLRTITPEDLVGFTPSWENDPIGKGFWYL